MMETRNEDATTTRIDEDIAMNGSSRLVAEKRHCLSAVSSKDQDGAAAEAVVDRPAGPSKQPLESLERVKADLKKKLIWHESTEDVRFSDCEQETFTLSYADTVKKKKPGKTIKKPQEETATEVNTKGEEYTPKQAERIRSTLIIRRTPYGTTMETVLEALINQFKDEDSFRPNGIQDHIDTITRDKFDKRRMYVTFKTYEAKRCVTRQGFSIGDFTIPGVPGDVSGFIPDVPYFLDIDDIRQLLAPYGTILKDRMRTFKDTNIYMGGYEFTMDLHTNKTLPNRIKSNNESIEIIDKNNRKLCTHCYKYGHLRSYCRQRQTEEAQRQTTTTNADAEVANQAISAPPAHEVLPEVADQATVAPIVVVEALVDDDEDIDMTNDQANLTDRESTEGEYMSDDGMVDDVVDGVVVGKRHEENGPYDIPIVTPRTRTTQETEQEPEKKKVRDEVGKKKKKKKKDREREKERDISEDFKGLYTPVQERNETPEAKKERIINAMTRLTPDITEVHYEIHSHSPIPSRPYVQQAWTPNSKNPSVSIPLCKIQRDGNYPENLESPMITYTQRIMENANNIRVVYDDFDFNAVIQLDDSRTNLLITLTNQLKHPELRVCQLKAFYHYIEMVIEMGRS